MYSSIFVFLFSASLIASPLPAKPKVDAKLLGSSIGSAIGSSVGASIGVVAGPAGI